MDYNPLFDAHHSHFTSILQFQSQLKSYVRNRFRDINNEIGGKVALQILGN